MRLPRKARRSGLAFAALVAALLVSAAPAAADMVTTLDNAGAGSLRSAIASTAAGATVTFAPGLDGTILLSEDLVIDKDLTIDGPSAQDLVISGNDATRVFQIYGLGTEVTIDDVTIRDGRADGDEPIGAGVWFIQGQALTLERVAVVSNESIKTDAVTPLGGGITVFDGHLEVIDSTLEDNRATDGTGGGLFIGTPATFEVSNSTIADNVASLGGGGLVSANAAGTITSSTIARNESSAQPGGGIRASGPAVVTLARSLVSGNSAGTAPDCLGPVASAGGNVLTSIAGCGIAPVASDATGVVAGLGPLGHHGGPTRTLLPLAGNPAIDHIPGPCPGADQRGVARPQANCDAGAVELRSAQLTALGPLALGSAQVGQQSAPVSVEITNAGDLDADITAVTLTGPNAAEVAPVADPDACTDATVLGRVRRAR
jgi:Right handed beta helix region